MVSFGRDPRALRPADQLPPHTAEPRFPEVLADRLLHDVALKPTRLCRQVAELGSKRFGQAHRQDSAQGLPPARGVWPLRYTTGMTPSKRGRLGVPFGRAASKRRRLAHKKAGHSGEVLVSSPARLPIKGESGHWEEMIGLA